MAGMHMNSPNNSADFNSLMTAASPRETIIPSGGAPIRIILGGNGAKMNQSKQHFYSSQQHQPQIFSQPIPQPKTVTRLGDNLYEEATFSCNYDIDNSHVNYGYDVTTATATGVHHGKPLISTVTIPPVSNVIINQNRMMIVSAKNAESKSQASKSQQSGQKNVKEFCIKIDDLLSKNFLLVDPNSTNPKPGFVKNMAAMANTAAAAAGAVNTLRKDNSQHLPQSIEKPMAKNFKSMNVGVPPKAVPDSSEEESSSSSSSSKTEVAERQEAAAADRNNDSTSLSITDQSLRDEDAWLPILNIAEEQVST